MPNEIITLNAPGGRLDALRDGGKTWLGVSQVCDTLGINRATFYRIIQRDQTLLAEGQLSMPWPTAGGEQMVSVYSLDTVLNVAMEVSNPRARRLRRWLVALLRGQAPVPRPAPDALARLPDARAILALPTVRAAISRLDAMDAADAEHQRRQARERGEVTRLAAMNGLSLDGLRKLRMLERILDSIPSLGVQAALPFDA